MGYEEKRKSRRHTRSESVSIQLLNEDDENSSAIVKEQTIDLSAEGIRIEVNRLIEQEIFFDICIELNDSHKRFLLTVEVKWSRTSDIGFEAGLEILPAKGTDFKQWFEHLNSLD